MVEKPLEIDIGCGKGKFLLARAGERPDIQFLGIDRVAKWMKIGQTRGEKRSLANLKFLKVEAREFLETLPPESVSVFHLYFPDPWPKRRHHKRRLVTADFLKRLHRPLVPGGFVEMATDDPDYFDQMKRVAAATGDLWNRIEESIGQRLAHPELKTNYELKYELAGKKNYYLELQKIPVLALAPTLTLPLQDEGGGDGRGERGEGRVRGAMRLARALALAGIASRRKCEVYIRAGEVAVNGEIVCDLGRQVDPERDEIFFRGRPAQSEKFIYFMLHKPAGYTTTASDPHAKKTVYDLLPRTLIQGSTRIKPDQIRVFPVGRLDKDSAGLLLFTNDGSLAFRLTHPRFEVPKRYEVRLHRAFDPADGPRLLAGVKLEEGIAKVDSFRPLSRRVLTLVLREGKKREVRRIFEGLGYRVLELCRTSFGPLELGKLPPARGRLLTPSEIRQLKSVIP